MKPHNKVLVLSTIIFLFVVAFSARGTAAFSSQEQQVAVQEFRFIKTQKTSTFEIEKSKVKAMATHSFN